MHHKSLEQNSKEQKPDSDYLSSYELKKWTIYSVITFLSAYLIFPDSPFGIIVMLIAGLVGLGCLIGWFASVFREGRGSIFIIPSIILLITFVVIANQNTNSKIQNSAPSQLTNTLNVNQKDNSYLEDSKPGLHYNGEILQFNGYECTNDCSGHQAGYDWAEENDIDNIDDCGGKSNSFIEGCYSYVEDNYGIEDEYDDSYYEDDYPYEY